MPQPRKDTIAYMWTPTSAVLTDMIGSDAEKLAYLEKLAKQRREIKALCSLACRETWHITAQELVQRLYNKKGINILSADEISVIILGETGRYVGPMSIKRMISSGKVKMCEGWSVQLWLTAVQAEAHHFHGNRLKELL